MRLTGFVVLVLLLSVNSFAQKITISGAVPGAEGKIIRLAVPGDLITFWEKPLAEARIDPAGKFSFQVDPGMTTIAWLSIDFHKAEMFLEPSAQYDIRFATLSVDESAEVNPFIQSQNLVIESDGEGPGRLNGLIREFDSVFSSFLTANFSSLYHERNKTLLDTFRVRLNIRFGSVKNPYFLDYATYKMASLEQMTQYYNRAQLARKYFTGKPILYGNVEYMDFFNSFFSKYFGATGAIRKVDIPSLLMGQAPCKALMKAMASDTILKNEQLRELVMLKGLIDLCRSDATLEEACLGVIGAVKDHGRFPENRIIAADMISMLTYLKPGTPAPDFTLKDLRGQDISLSTLRGKPVLLTFWTTYCQECLSGLDMIVPLFGRYRENMHFVSISSDRSFSKMAYFINLKRDYSWTFLHVGEQTEVLKNYDVRSYPLYVLIDREGRIDRYAAGGPGEGLEAEVEKLLQK